MRLTSDWPASGKVLLVSSTMPAVVMNRPRGLFSNVRMAAHCMKPWVLTLESSQVRTSRTTSLVTAAPLGLPSQCIEVMWQ